MKKKRKYKKEKTGLTKKRRKQINIHTAISIALFLVVGAVAVTNESIDYFGKIGIEISPVGALGITTVALLLVGIYMMWSILTRFSVKLY